MVIYADDTCIFYQEKDIHKIEDVVNKELLTLYKQTSLLQRIAYCEILINML